jgi:FkbM family methyltransferase
MDRFEHRLNVLKNNGVNINNLLDIGAYRGEFTQMVRRVWPNVRSWQLEADERQGPYLQSDAIFGLLSSKANVEVDFYTLDTNSVTTGSSMYRELTSYYNNPIVVKKRTTTLDDVMKRVNFRGNWKNCGLVKMDTQGSELDILKGGENFLQTYQPKYFIIENSVKQYNAGAPLIDDVISFMFNKGYRIKDIMSYMYDQTETLLQTDILFERIV